MRQQLMVSHSQPVIWIWLLSHICNTCLEEVSTIKVFPPFKTKKRLKWPSRLYAVHFQGRVKNCGVEGFSAEWATPRSRKCLCVCIRVWMRVCVRVPGPLDEPLGEQPEIAGLGLRMSAYEISDILWGKSAALSLSLSMPDWLRYPHLRCLRCLKWVHDWDQMHPETVRTHNGTKRWCRAPVVVVVVSTDRPQPTIPGPLEEKHDSKTCYNPW